MRETFLRNLYYLMDERKWTLTRLSLESGISFSTISSFLYLSKSMPKVETIDKLAKALDVTAADLVSEDMVERIQERKALESVYKEALDELTRLEKAIGFVKTTIRKNPALLTVLSGRAV